MKYYEKIYQELRKKYTDEEIAESMMIPQDLTEEEQRKADEELKAFRFKLLREQTEQQRILSDIMRFRFQLEEYVKNQIFTSEKSFGKSLEEYARILNQTKKKLSEDLAIHYTRLSRIINDKEAPNVELAFRLEKHSGNLISALLWWKLFTKKQDYLIQKDVKTRKLISTKVKVAVKL
ncbi:MAG: hypothetical protein ACPGVB_09730 [Chitinophagales bacterium]